MERTVSATTLAKMGDTLSSLRWELEKMTINCKKKDEALDSKNQKIEEQQSSLSLLQKELDASKAELDKERCCMSIIGDQIKELESQKVSLEQELQLLSSTMIKREESIRLLLLRVDAQSSEHELKIKNMEDEFSKMMAEAKGKQGEEIKMLQYELQHSRSEHSLQLELYQKKVDELELQMQKLMTINEDKADSVCQTLKRCEERMEKLHTDLLNHLECTEKGYLVCERALDALRIEADSRHLAFEWEVEKLQTDVSEAHSAQERIHAAALQDYWERLQAMEREWMSKLQEERESAETAIEKLNEMQAAAMNVAVYNHQVEFSVYKATLDDQKAQEIRELKEGYKNLIQTLELERKEAASRLEQLQLEKREAVEECMQKQNAIIQAHQQALEAEMSKAQEEMRLLKEKHALELSSAALTMSSEMAMSHSVELEDQHKKHIDRLVKDHTAEMQRLQHTLRVGADKHASDVAVLNCRIASLEALCASANERVGDLIAENQELEKAKDAVIEQMKLSHEKAFNFQRCRFMKDKRAAAKSLEMKYRIELDKCNAFHGSQYEKLQQELGRTKVALAQKQRELSELQQELSSLKDRFASRESRPEDVQRIAALKQECRALQELCNTKDMAYQKLDAETHHIRLEMINREETYNRIFRRGSPLVQHGTAEWAKPRSPSRSAQGSRSRQSQQQHPA